MKTTILALAFGFMSGGFLAYSQTAKHYKAKSNEILLATATAVAEQKEQVRVITNEYEKQLKIANSKPADVITERVFVRASCPVRTDTVTGVGDTGADSRAELAESTIRSLERLTKELDKQYREAVYALRACVGAVTIPK